MLNRNSPLRVEVNPWTLDDTLAEVMQLRGAYIAAMGTIETMLTEIAIRASRHKAYAAIRGRFPSRRPDRLKYLEAICATHGPLAPHRSLIRIVVGRFQAGADLRDVMAHGRMQVLTGPGDDANIKLEDYTAAGEAIRYRRDQYTLKALRPRVYRMTRLSRAVDKLYSRADSLLPPVQGHHAD